MCQLWILKLSSMLLDVECPESGRYSNIALFNSNSYILYNERKLIWIQSSRVCLNFTVYGIQLHKSFILSLSHILC